MTDYELFTTLLDLFGVRWDAWWDGNVSPSSASAVYGFKPRWSVRFRGHVIENWTLSHDPPRPLSRRPGLNYPVD